MILLLLGLIILTMISGIICIDSDEFYTYFCAADEEHIHEVFGSCEYIFKEAVGIFNK